MGQAFSLVAFLILQKGMDRFQSFVLAVKKGTASRHAIREAYARGDYERARECFERAARFADKPSQAMLGEMHWEGLGGQRDRALGYAWMDLAAERYYEDFYLLRERYWSQLGAQEREQALRRGQPLLRKYGDDKAKRRLARILVRQRPDQLAIGGFFGNLPIIPPSGAGRDSITLRGSD